MISASTSPSGSSLKLARLRSPALSRLMTASTNSAPWDSSQPTVSASWVSAARASIASLLKPLMYLPRESYACRAPSISQSLSRHRSILRAVNGRGVDVGELMCAVRRHVRLCAVPLEGPCVLGLEPCVFQPAGAWRTPDRKAHLEGGNLRNLSRHQDQPADIEPHP